MGIWHGTGVPLCDVHTDCYCQRCCCEVHFLLVVVQREIVNFGIAGGAPLNPQPLRYVVHALRISECPSPPTEHVRVQPIGIRMLFPDLFDPRSLSLVEQVEIGVTAVADHAGVIR